MKDWIYRIRRLVTSSQVDQWCKLPYPNHKKGCPNYGRHNWCPPFAGRVGDWFDISRPLFLVHSEFDLVAHVGRMGRKHPQWSERQCRCVLYWQGTSRKQLREHIVIARQELGTNLHTTCPEGMGVNVYATARLSGLRLERIRNLSICRHVAMLGWKKN